MSRDHILKLDGKAVSFEAGETLLDVAKREGIDIPTLCHDSRLDPVGACRSCLVEIDGWRRMAPSCVTPAADGMSIRTDGERIDRHRRNLMGLYLSDLPDQSSTDRAVDLFNLADQSKAPKDWLRMEPIRQGRQSDRNPYVHFDPELCILCSRCTRYCDEVEAVEAITLAGRGSRTTISTVDEKSLMDTTCELCGGCIDVCPTGAMTEKPPITIGARPDQEQKKVRTTCNYCGVGCQFDINVDPDGNEGRGKIVKITSPDAGTTTNDGNLCVKGRFSYDFVDHEDRLKVPLIRGEDGELHEASWEEAIRVASEGLQGVKDRHGADALGFVSSSRCTGEENYLVQKLARSVYRTNNVHSCAAT